MLWSRLVSNQRPSACEADALPLSYETGELDRTIERRRRLARSGLSPRILKAGSPVRREALHTFVGPSLLCRAIVTPWLVVANEVAP
jgi:hypothetical protein